jgi:hypothetical protein
MLADSRCSYSIRFHSLLAERSQMRRLLAGFEHGFGCLGSGWRNYFEWEALELGS